MTSVTTLPFDVKRIKGIICNYDGCQVKPWTNEIIEGVPEIIQEIFRSGLRFAVATQQAGPLWYEISEKPENGKRSKYPPAESFAQNFLEVATQLHTLSWVPYYLSICDPRIEEILQPTLLESVTEATLPEPAPPGTLDDAYEVLLQGVIERIRLPLLAAGMTVTISSDPSWRKPNPGMFKQIEQDWYMNPQEIVCIGDREEDKMAAQSAGMHHITCIADLRSIIDAAHL